MTDDGPAPFSPLGVERGRLVESVVGHCGPVTCLAASEAGRPAERWPIG